MWLATIVLNKRSKKMNACHDGVELSFEITLLEFSLRSHAATLTCEFGHRFAALGSSPKLNCHNYHIIAALSTPSVIARVYTSGQSCR